MTQVAQRNNHVLQMLKRLKETLDNDKKKYADKVNVLVMTWERIAASAKEQRPLAAICIVEKMYKDTLGIMLQGEWPKMSPVSKTHLMQMLNRCRADLCKEMPWLNCKFRKLLELVNDPWTLPSLERILHKDPSPATPEQIIEFCESERGLLIVTRLAMLCSSRCEKVAIKLAEACFGALSGGNRTLLSFFTTNEYNFIFEIYLCLLYKYKKLEYIINALKTLSVAEGYYLVFRLRKRSDFHEQKIWKFSHQVAAVASRYFVTVSMLSRSIPNPALLKNLIRDWLTMSKPEENNVENEVRKVIQPAETSEHIYIMAEVLTSISQKLPNQMYSSLIMELYIRALTADINYLERVKLQNDKNQMTDYEKHLASKFLALADLVKDHSGVRREFVLTAFSIHPSAEIYRRVEEEAMASGKASPHSTSQESIEAGVLSEGLSSLWSEETEGKDIATDYSVNNDSQDSGAFVEISNKCPLHLPYDGIGPEGELCFQCGDFTGMRTSQITNDQQQKKKERSLDALILIKGSTVTESLNYDVLSAPSQVLEAEKLGLSSQVCADLVTLLGSNRYHLLTWVLEWGELSSRCLRYMNEADTIKSGKKELKFLEIDYNQYKDWPENDDEADCIEKGYEQWLEADNTETDFDTDSKRSNTDDSEELMIKTAIRRSQKQLGRYAESSSDSENSRSRPRNRKRGRPRKRLKSYSDSGSVSDSLGSDGQKQKSTSKKRTKSKDLRKTLGRLKYMEMTSDSNASPNNDSFSPEILSGKDYKFTATTANARSDPTVLKSLRAFRPTPHKIKNDFIQSVTENCYDSKTISGKTFSNKKSTVFDCNDNKFITKEDRFSFDTKDMELHFKTSGVGTKKYNDVIRTIKEDLISVSNIPSVTNNATVNVVHVHDSPKLKESSETNQTTATSGGQTTSVVSTMASRNVHLTTSIQKPKPESESSGSQIKKSTSSQVSSQSTAINYGDTVITTSTPTLLTSSLTRVVPAISKAGQMLAASNQVLSSIKASGSKVINQQQYMAIMNRNSFNQINNPTSLIQNIECQTVSNTVVGFVTTSSAKSMSQNFITQATRTPVQTARVVAVSAADTSRFVLENDRPNVIFSKNFGVQNIRAGGSTLFNNVSQGLNNVGVQVKKFGESSYNVIKPNGNVSDNTALTSDNSDQGNLRLPFENAFQTNLSPTKVTIINSKPGDLQKPSNETRNLNIIGASNSTSFFNRQNTYPKNVMATAVLTNQTSAQTLIRSNINAKTPSTVILQASVPVAGRNSSLTELSGIKKNFSIVKTQTASNADLEDLVPRSALIKNVTAGAPLTLELRNISSIVTSGVATTTTATTFGTRNYGATNLIVNKTPYNEVVRIVQGMTGHSQTATSSPDVEEINASTSETNQINRSEGGEVIAIIDPSTAVKLDSNTVDGKNILATVLKRNSLGNVVAPNAITSTQQFSISNSGSPVESSSNQNDGAQNVMISQNSNGSTIHYTVINSNQSETSQNKENSLSSDSNERGEKSNNIENQPSIISSLLGQIENSNFTNDASIAGPSSKNADKFGSHQDLNRGVQQLLGVDVKKINKSNSSLSTVQTESSFIKKQVLNNQKITILVQNNEKENRDDSDKADNQQKNKLNELLYRDDQKTCITFRAIKRTQQPEKLSSGDLSAKKKFFDSETSEIQNGSDDKLKEENYSSQIAIASESKTPASNSESLCQYLVLEAINDPAGALPKFNQAFGKSYQVKIPQAVRTIDSGETSSNAMNEGVFGITNQNKVDSSKMPGNETLSAAAHSSNQVPVTETPRELNTFEIVQKPVKSVYIDKDVKLSVQTQSTKANERLTTEAASISTIQMTEVQQQPTTYHPASKVPGTRSSVVQQFLRKVPATGTPTLQAVNSINTLTAKQIKTPDIVPGSTLIYTTEARPQSQIVIQRAVGRVGNPAISQVAPVIYTQNPGDHPSPQTQTLLLAAVPAGTRSVAPGTQLLRLPSSSGVWKMTSSVNPPRIVQFRPQNLVLQGSQDQGGSLLMQSGQSVLLHHLTSLPVKPIGVIASNTKADQTAKIDEKNDVYSKPEISMDDAKMCSAPLEVDQTSGKSESSSPAATASEHETVSLMKDIKEFENVFEETKLKFEMEEQQGSCLSDVDTITRAKSPLPGVNVPTGAATQPVHQTVLVQPQLMLHKPQMIITSAVPSQPTIFTQKIEKQLTLDKEPEKRLILTTKPKLTRDESSPNQHVAVAYVSHATPTSVSVQKPLVVVTNYTQPPTSPAPSVASQNSSSPNSVVCSVSFSGSANSSSKTPIKTKSRGMKTVLNPSKSPPVAKPQQKPQEDANTAQKIYAILEEYAVQLRNSPDMNNRPAPRRRSNPPTGTSAKRKKTICKSKESFSDGDETNFAEDGTETVANSENTSGGVTVLQVCVSSSH